MKTWDVCTNCGCTSINGMECYHCESYNIVCGVPTNLIDGPTVLGVRYASKNSLEIIKANSIIQK